MLAACTVLFLRVLVLVSILAPLVAPALLIYFAPPFLIGLGMVALALRRRSPVAESTASDVKSSRLVRTGGPIELGAKAIAIGVLSNAILKLSLSVALGSARFRRPAALGLLALAGGSVLGLVLAA